MTLDNACMQDKLLEREELLRKREDKLRLELRRLENQNQNIDNTKQNAVAPTAALTPPSPSPPHQADTVAQNEWEFF